MPLLLCLQKLQGKGEGEWEKKCLYIVFRLTQRSRVHGEGGGGGIRFLPSSSNKFLLVARHILTKDLQKDL